MGSFASRKRALDENAIMQDVAARKRQNSAFNNAKMREIRIEQHKQMTRSYRKSAEALNFKKGDIMRFTPFDFASLLIDITKERPERVGPTMAEI